MTGGEAIVSGTLALIMFGVLADSWVAPASRRFGVRRRPAGYWVGPASRRFRVRRVCGIASSEMF